MSYNPLMGAGSAIFTEFTCTSNSVTNSAFRWDNTSKRSTSSSSVSVNSTTGEITLPAGAVYWLMASVDLTRSSVSNSVKAKWVNVNGEDLVSLSGGSRVELVGSSNTSANMLAQLCVDVPTGAADFVCKLLEHSGFTQTPNTTMSLIIKEVR